MSQIDGFNQLGVRPMQDVDGADVPRNQPQQLATARPLTEAASLLQNIEDGSLSEAAESMSLMMGSRLRPKQKADAKDNSGRLREMLMNWVPKVEGQRLVELLATFAHLGSGGEDPIQTMQQSGVPSGAMILLLSSLLNNRQLDPKRRQRLESALATLLDDEDIDIDVFSFLELGALSESDLAPLKQLYRRSQQQEESPKGLSEWFEEVRNWPDRRVRLRILIRALALDLGQEANHEQQVQIVSVLMDLKRLLLFFGLEEHCAFLAHSVGISAEQGLVEVLSMLEQSWIYPEWLEERMQQLSIIGELRFVYVRRVLELLRLMPSPCFQDDEQATQLIDAFEQLQERWLAEENEGELFE